MQDALGAFVGHCDVRIDGAASGPLAGCCFAAKDLYDVRGTVTGCGNPDWIRTHSNAQSTAPVIQRLLDAGATLVGKTLTDELAYSLNGENHHFGTPVNANAPGRIPGGSSSGSAAAVAGGLVDFALGTDTGGSVRIPASFCGIYGIRPTHDRILLDGVQPLAAGFDTIGWFARDPALLEAVGRVVFDWREPTPPSRLLVPRDLWALVPPETERALASSLAALAERIGAREDIVLADSGIEECFEAFRILQGREVWATHRNWIGEAKPAFGPGVKERFEWAATLTAGDQARAQSVRDAIARRLQSLLPPGTIMAAPVAPGPAPVLNAPPGAVDDIRTRILKLTCFAGLGGLPQICLPSARVDGLPVAFSVIAGRGCDEALLSLATELARKDAP